LLGFDAPTGNTYGSIATVDYLLESVSATSTLLIGLGRVLQDFLLWCTMEFGYLRLGEGFVQSSSIMPQKRNPVALEHARAIGSKAVGQAQAIATAVHNTPFGDIVDTEDDLQPLVASMFRDATRTVALMAATMKDADFDVERLAARAGYGGTTLTELADTLVREEGLAFRTAHSIAALLLKARNENPSASLAEALANASRALVGRVIEASDERLQEVLSPRYFVNVRRTLGGPAPEETARALAEQRDLLARDHASWQRRRERLTTAEQQLRQRSRAL
jgi:argininosuccinate lyase